MSFAYNHQVANENEQVFFGLKPRISKKHENTRQAANVNPLHRYFGPNQVFYKNKITRQGKNVNKQPQPTRIFLDLLLTRPIFRSRLGQDHQVTCKNKINSRSGAAYADFSRSSAHQVVKTR